MNDKTKKYKKEYRLKNLAKFAEYSRKWRYNNPEKHRQAQLKIFKRYGDEWLTILKNKFGSLSCSKCGFDRHFCAIDFHHVGCKNEDLSKLIRQKPTNARIAELDNGILLCKNCHAIEHYQMRTS